MKKIPALLVIPLLIPCAALAGDVVIYHTGDIHGRFGPRPAALYGSTSPVTAGGFAALAALAGAEKSPALLLDSGDWSTGAPEGDLSGGLAAVRLMNAAGYSAAVIGNHEYDHGTAALEKALAAAKFKPLGANIFSGARRAPYAAPFVMLEAGGRRIAVIGLASPKTPLLTLGDVSALSFGPEKEALAAALEETAKLSPDAVVVLAHDGLYTGDYVDGASWRPAEGAEASGTLALARAAGGRAQLVLGGHNHTLLLKPYRDPVSGALIGESGSGLLYATRAVLHFDDATGRFAGAEAAAVPLTGAEDPAVKAVYGAIAGETRAAMAVKLGEAAADIPREPGSAAYADSPIGSLFCDIIRAYAGTDLALQNTEGVRRGLVKGPVTFRDIYEVTPYDADLVTLRLTGAQIKAIMTEAVRGGRSDVQVSGLEVTYSSSAAGPYALSLTAGGKPLDEGRGYSVAANNFFLRSPRWKALAAGRGEVRKVLLRDIVVSAIRKSSGPLRPPEPGRIRPASRP